VGNDKSKLGSRTLARAAQFGLTITDSAQFEQAADVEVLLVNKAGTLTSTIRKVAKSRLAYGSPLSSQDELLAIAASIELGVDHPIAHSIVAAAKNKNLELQGAVDARLIPGQGIAAIIDGEAFYIGGPALLTAKNIPIYVDDLVRSDSANQLGHTVIYVVLANQLLGMIELSETVLPEAAQFVNMLHAKKIRVAMVTGDASGVAQNVASQLNIAEVFAEINPSRKGDVVRKLRADGSRVTVAGSLGSDSLALAEAQVGIALDSDGLTDSSAAGLHLDSASLESIYKTIILSKRIKFQRSQKIIAIFASAMVAIGVIVVLISPR
jgi:Cu2+-exporting ATPase